MLQITDKSKCCGCNACVQRCPKQCIEMHDDKEGFLYPVIDTAVCIDCGLCEKVCPVLNQNNARKPLQVFAAKNKNEIQRLHSSSGGIFILLAEQIIQNGGVVFGARFDKNWEVEHCYAETIEELQPLMRSKYVQSRIANTYKEAESFLKHGRQVLFVGTSCQIAGLHKFLRKDYDNLLTVDFICHGVPSPGVWRKYLEEIISDKSSRSEVAGKNTVLPFSLKSVPVITGINFREKQLGGYRWKKFGFVVHEKSPFKGDQNSVLLSTVFNENDFMRGFLSNLILRPSCYSCPAKDGKSGSDLTIADFWGINNFYPEFDDDKGVGVVFVHTEKGKSIFSSIEVEYMEVQYDEAVRANSSYYKSVSIPVGRIKFWKNFHNGKTISESLKKAMLPSFSIRMKIKIKSILKNFIKR